MLGAAMLAVLAAAGLALWDAQAQVGNLVLSLEARDGIADDATLELNGAFGVATFQVNGSIYAAVASAFDNGVQILDVSDPSDISATDQITDGGSLELNGARDVATFQVNGSIYAAVASAFDNGVQILDVSDPADISATDQITDGGSLELGGASGIAIFQAGGSTYAAVASFDDDGVQILDVSDPHNVTATDQITDGGSLALDGPRAIATFQAGGSIYAAVASAFDNGVQILDVSDPGNVTATDQITDDATLELNGATGITTFQAGGKTYAAVASSADNGVQILDVSDPSDISATDQITDDATLELEDATGITTFQAGGSTYAAVASSDDDGVQILDVSDPHNISATDQITDDATLELEGATGIATFQTGGGTYAAVASSDDSGVQILQLAAVDPPPTFVSSELNTATGKLSITFSEAVDVTPVSMVEAAKIHVRESGNYTHGVTLTAAELDTAADSATITFTLTAQHLAAVQGFTTPELTIEPGAVQDAAGNTIVGTFDVSTASFVDSFSVSAQEGSPQGVAFSGDGAKMFVVGTNGDSVNEYGLTAPFDVSTASFVDSFDVSAQETLPNGVAFSGDGAKMFVVGASGDDVNEYGLTAPFDVSTASFVDSFDVSAQEDFPNGVAFSGDGAKMFVVGTIGDSVNEYGLAAPFDVSTASFVDSFNVSAQDTLPNGVAFSGDGAKMFVMGSSGDDVNEYGLTAPFDVSTASFVDSFDVSAQETLPTGVAFSGDGAKMFVVGASGVDVNEYDLASVYPITLALVVDAGDDQTVSPGATVTLDGTGSAGAGISYSWAQTFGASVTLSNTTAASPAFAAPAGTHTLTFALTATDTEMQTGTDTVTITVGSPVLALEARDGITDGGSLELSGAFGVATFQVNGSIYAAVASAFDNGVQILDVSDPSDISATDQITDGGSLELDGARDVATFHAGGGTYAAVASFDDGGVQILDVSDPSDISATDQITDDATLELEDARGITTFQVDGRTYAAVASFFDDGVQILDVSDPSDISATDQITDGGSLELDGARAIATFHAGGKTYAAVASSADHGVQILDVSDPHDISATDQITDDATLELAGATGITTFQAGGSIYAAVASFADDGVQILDVSDPSDISATDQITDDATLELESASGITTFQAGGSIYAAVASFDDDGVQILDISDPHNVTAADQITDGGSLELNGPRAITTFQTGGSTYAAVASSDDDGVQILRLATDTPPVADAGDDQTVTPGTTVTLDGSDSEDNDSITYSWAQDSGTSVTLSNTTAESPTFTAPAGPATLVFTLTVTDTASQSSTDTVTVTVSAPNVPVADAGPDRTVGSGATVTLDGSASTGTSLDYLWEQDSGPAVALSSDTAASPAFTAPAGPATLVFTLTVEDPESRQSTDSVTITVRAAEAPVADAGRDRTVSSGATVTLDGSRSTGASISHSWAQDSGPAVSLSSATAESPTFTAPAGPATLAFTLTVTDSSSRTDTDTVTIRVSAPPRDPDTNPNLYLLHLRSSVPSQGDPDYSSDARCVDPQDGDISHLVTTSITRGQTGATITYSCTDSDGNRSAISRAVASVTDTSPPRVVLNGASPTTVKLGSAWSDPGATCVDDVDPPKPATVYSSRNPVDTGTAGKYTITYWCEDSSGNWNSGDNVRTVYVTADENLKPVLSIPDIPPVRVGGSFTPPPATCHDAEDGAITDITIYWFDDLDTSKAGTYYFSYRCTDSAGKFAEKVTSVTVS